MTKKSVSSPKPSSGQAHVSPEMAAHLLSPLRLLGWAILLYTLIEVAAIATFSLKLKNTTSEWTFFSLCAERAWGYILWGLALTLIVPAGPIRKWELISLRLSHYLCAIGFITCLIAAPIGWIRWNNLRKEITSSFTQELRKSDGKYQQLRQSLENETELERLRTIAKVSGLQDSVKDISNPGELNAELLRRLTIERDSKRDNINNSLFENSRAHKMSIVRAMGALGIACLFMGIFWWLTRAFRRQLSLAGEKHNSSDQYFPYA